MKKSILSLLFLSFVCCVYSQTVRDYSIKANFLYGTILEHNKHLENLVTGPATGGSLAFEWQTSGSKVWHQYLNFPTMGVEAVMIDFSNPEMLGQGLGFYPYLGIPIIRTNYFKLNLKPGAGISFLSKWYSNAPHQDGTLNGANGESNGANGAIGSMVNVFLTCGGNMEIPIASGVSLTADYAWNHVSNGSVIQPNSGINMMNAYVGLKYRPNYRTTSMPERKELSGIPRKFSTEVSLAGGVRELYYKDDTKFPIGALSVSVHRPMTNWYRMGVGADVFYDGVFGAVYRDFASEATKNTTSFARTYITSDEKNNKFRAGVSWQHELIIGRLITGFHFGLYLYDPIKNREPFNGNGELNKPLIYGYDIDKEDGWLYTRASAKYMITDHFFAAVSLKTHLQKAEFIAWGIGCRF